MRRTARPHAVRRTAAATIAVLALAGLTACNDDSPTATEEPDSPTTSASSSESAGASPSAGETVDPATFVDDVLAGMADATTAHMVMKVEGGPAEMSMEGDVDYSATPPEMAMTMNNAMLGKGDIEMRMVDGAMYVQVPMLQSGKWVKVPLTGKDSPLGGDLLGQMNPGRMLEEMKGAIDDVTYVGEEDVDGETLQHYTMTVRSEAFQKMQDQFGGTGAVDLPSLITYDLWTDDDGLMRQTKVSLGDLGSVAISMSDWGAPVQIEAPPQSEIAELPGGMSMMS
jgi:hypothetical protein